VLNIHTVEVKVEQSSYPILIGSAVLTAVEYWPFLNRKGKAVVLTNTIVHSLYYSDFEKSLRVNFDSIEYLILPDGEEYKNWKTLNLIFDKLLESNCDRQTVLFALGGGIVGDMTGFAASCFMRGVPFVQVPTTLLAQVDSSVGGKTGINHPLGKNMIGAFHQPQFVICDLATLRTLPSRELSAGLAEVIKYGPIADTSFMTWLESNLDALRDCETFALAHAVKRSCEIKAHIVGLDERESGIRAILNFGHTFGHAIEAGLGFGVWLHGEAVGCGMVMAAHLSQRLGLVDAVFVDRLTRLIERAGLPIRGPALGAKRYMELMRNDKKSHAGEIRFVLIDGPGAGKAVLRTAPDALVCEVIQQCCA
jgi:3-dehydroquinate synthase